MLQNAIIDEIFKIADRGNCVPTPDDTVTVWGEEGMERLRDVCVDLFVWKRTEKLVEGHEDSWDEGFLRRLVGGLKRKGDAKREENGGEAPWRVGWRRCERYHVHDGWAPGCVDKRGG